MTSSEGTCQPSSGIQSALFVFEISVAAFTPFQQTLSQKKKKNNISQTLSLVLHFPFMSRLRLNIWNCMCSLWCEIFVQMWLNCIPKNCAFSLKFSCDPCNKIFHGPMDQFIEYMKSHDEKLKSETITDADFEVQNKTLLIVIMFSKH
jgi:hypothetical protein